MEITASFPIGFYKPTCVWRTIWPTVPGYNTNSRFMISLGVGGWVGGGGGGGGGERGSVEGVISGWVRGGGPAQFMQVHVYRFEGVGGVSAIAERNILFVKDAWRFVTGPHYLSAIKAMSQ